MEIERLREFTCLARTLNYHVAANQCYISHSTLSKHIASMERELGCRFFVRNKASVSLTAYGKMLLGHAEGILKAYDECLDEINLVKTESTKSLSVCYMYEAAHLILSELYQIIRVERADLGLDLNLKLLQLEELKPRLDDDLTDVVIGVDQDFEDTTTYRKFPIYRDRAAVIVPPTHEFAKRESMPIEELAGHRVIVPSVSEKGFRSKFFKDAFGPSLAKDVKFESMFSDPMEIPWYMNSNSGIALASGFVYDELHDPNLVCVFLEGKNVSFNISAIWKAKNETQALRNFIEVLAELTQADNYSDFIPPSASKPT